MAEAEVHEQDATVPAWFWVVGVAALLFELLGCFFYFVEVRMSAADIAALPLDQAAMLAARPSWYYAAFGIAVWVGLAGAILLLLRRQKPRQQHRKNLSPKRPRRRTHLSK